MTAAVRLLAAPVIWFVHFGITYGSLSLLCNAGLGRFHLALVIGATVLAAGLLLALARRSDTESRFVDLGGFALALLTAVAVLWTALAALLLPAC